LYQSKIHKKVNDELNQMQIIDDYFSVRCNF